MALFIQDHYLALERVQVLIPLEAVLAHRVQNLCDPAGEVTAQSVSFAYAWATSGAWEAESRESAQTGPTGTPSSACTPSGVATRLKVLPKVIDTDIIQERAERAPLCDPLLDKARSREVVAQAEGYVHQRKAP